MALLLKYFSEIEKEEIGMENGEDYFTADYHNEIR
jgi:hypothetical protein